MKTARTSRRSFMPSRITQQALACQKSRNCGAPAIPDLLNDAGQVVGISISADDRIDAFLWRDGVMTKLPIPADGGGRASDINEAGQVVGGHYLYMTSATPVAPPPGTAFLIAAAGLGVATFAFYHARRNFRPRKNPNRR